MIKVMLVDDQEMIRIALRTIIDAQDEMRVSAEAPDGLAALRLLDAEVPDVVLMDLRMPGIDGVETTRRIRRNYPPEQVRIVVLTTFDQDVNVLSAIKAGANGFLSKGVGPGELAAAIREVHQGGGALSPNAAAAVIGHVSDDAWMPVETEAAQAFEQLTARELELVKGAMLGKTNHELAEELFISPLTVKTHINHAMTKLGVNDRAQLIALAFRSGIQP